MSGDGQADWQKAPYELLGGDAAVRSLVERFYDLMETIPEASGVRALHPSDLSGSREKLYLFLSGWLGGPSLYIERFGHPRLRARHLPFPIGEAERDQWLLCMRRALEEEAVEPALGERLLRSFALTADHMRNRGGPPPAGR